MNKLNKLNKLNKIEKIEKIEGRCPRCGGYLDMDCNCQWCGYPYGPIWDSPFLFN